MRRLIAALFFLCLALPAWPQNYPPTCNMAAQANLSRRNIGTSSTTLIPAPPNNIPRTGIFIELLTASAKLAINPTGGVASTTAAGNIVISTSGSAPNDTAYINFTALGFVPQGAITAIADGSSRVVTVYACPE